MKFLLAVVFVIALFMPSLAKTELDLEDPGAIVKLLGSEPAAASQSRFAETRQTDAPSFVSPTPDTITFRDSQNNQEQSSGTTDSSGVDTSEFDAQLEKLDGDVKKLEEAIDEEKECYKRLKRDEARHRALLDQKSRVEKEKEKKILETRLEQQLRDQHDLRHMIDRLKGKANELRRTQNIIGSKVIATRQAIRALDSNAVDDDSDAEPGEDLANAIEGLHKQKTTEVDRQNKNELSRVKGFIKTIADSGEKEIKAETQN